MKRNPTAAMPWMPPRASRERLEPNPDLVRWAAAFALFLIMVSPSGCRAQEATPRLELFGGYSYVRFDSKSFGFAGQSGLNGFDVMLAGNLVPGFGVVAEASGNYGPRMNFRAAVFGPQFLFQRGKNLRCGWPADCATRETLSN
jgi:hypothetical protein